MSINVDKALDIIPPLAGEIYVKGTGPTTPAQGVFEIPGVRVSQGGTGPQSGHRFLANFISVQAELEDAYVAFGADPSITVDRTAESATFAGNNPTPAQDPVTGALGCILIPAGQTLRVDLTGLTQQLTLSPELPGPPVVPATYVNNPVQYMAYQSTGILRVWRSSGTGQ